MATAAPLMPKATAVWLLDNTALSFDQIAEFCKLHPLEIKAIADGDAAQGIKGLDPIQTGQLTREQITAAEADHSIPLKLAEQKVSVPQPERGGKKGPRYTPVSRRQDRPNAILWLVRNHPELKDCADHAARRHHQVDDLRDPRPHPLERASARADGSGDARACHADRSRFRGQPRQQGKAGAGRHRRDLAAGRRNHRAQGGGSRRRRRGSREQAGRQRPQRLAPCSPSSSSSAAKTKTKKTSDGEFRKDLVRCHGRCAS